MLLLTPAKNYLRRLPITSMGRKKMNMNMNVNIKISRNMNYRNMSYIYMNMSSMPQEKY